MSDSSHPGRASPEEAKLQPPFPLAGTSPDSRRPPPPHPNAEAFINAAAKHAFPSDETPRHDVPNADNEGATNDKVSHEGRTKNAEKEEREEEPLMAGTPLDEMTPLNDRAGGRTPNGEYSAFPLMPIEEKSPAVPSTPAGPFVEGVSTGTDDEESRDVAGQMPRGAGRATAARPGFGAGHEMGSVRMGASALVSALNALPWEGDSDNTSSSSDDDDGPESRQRYSCGRIMGKSMLPERASRPKMNRLGSSLNTIRPMHSSYHADNTPSPGTVEETPRNIHQPPLNQKPSSLHFPFRANTAARRARRPGTNELSYQYDQEERIAAIQAEKALESDETGDRRGSAGSENSLDSVSQQQLNKVVSTEEEIGKKEEVEEVLKTVSDDKIIELAPVISSGETAEINTDAALREAEGGDEVVEEMMEVNPSERHRVRKERLAERLQEVFGLEEREEVLEEMRCWLLRSVMLKGYMYLTPRHMCFFALMPDKKNLVVKTGPLYKKASRTKINTKFWVVLKNDVLSWFESTADPYFPKGNVSLQYASSCDAIEDTKFKLRTAERNYTFTADTEATRDEWVKTIEKVMFKIQHEGETVKLIIPLDVIIEVEKTPTLEFAETIEVKCVDPEDQMSIDSYFFASFQDDERAYKSIQELLASRPPADLPRVNSHLSQGSANTITSPSKSNLVTQSTTQQQTKTENDSNTSLVAPIQGGLKKLGSVLKPLVSRGGGGDKDKVEEDGEREEKSTTSVLGIPIPKPRSKSIMRPSHDSQETLRNDESSHDPEDDGYPPRQSGHPPSGMQDDGPGGSGKNWTPTWIAKPVSKILGSSPSKNSLSLGKTTSNPTSSSGGINRIRSSSNTNPRTRKGRGHSNSITEVVEPAIPQSSGEETDTDDSHDHDHSDYDHDDDDEHHGDGRERPRLSFGALGGTRSSFSLLEKSISNKEDEDATAKKFRSVFSLSEKEELIDHFPGYLYRVLPVSGRFFISTNFFCFRSSQLLYKTKMIIPIRDLYGLKAQKAFRFGHSGLIVVIKGHEELFLEFSSSRRRKACISLLEERMEDVRMRGERGDPDPVTVQSRIMEDLDESLPIEARGGDPGDRPSSPSPLFGSTTSTFLEFKPEPMKITCLTIGSRGDVQPYIALCKGLQAEGHTTRIASHGEYKDWVEGHGIEFASVGGDPAELMQMCVDNGMFTVSFLKEGLQKFRGWLDDLLNSSWEACQGSDLLIESPSAMGGIHIAEALRIPYYRAFTMPWTRTRAYPHAFAVPEHKRGGSYNYMTYTMFDQVFWRAISGQVNRWRKHTLNIESTNFDKLEQHKVPFLYNFSPSVVPPPLDWTEWIHVTGYWFLENADENASKEKESKWSPPDGLLEFIEKAHEVGKKVVYIGFGSIVVSDPQEMTKCVVDAVKESGVYAILSKGWSDRGSKAKGDTGDSEGADGIKYPDEIFSIDSIDHSWLFPRIDAACHHGGAGTSGASLRAGIPTIIKPFFGDQAFWSERVESLNVGSAVRKLTVESLAEALKKATTDEKQVAKAKIVGEMIRKENGVARAIEAIYRDLEYAKSLIKPEPEKEQQQQMATPEKKSSRLPDLLDLRSPISRSRRGSGASATGKVPTPKSPRKNEGRGSRPLSIDMSQTSQSQSQFSQASQEGQEHHSDESWDVVSDSEEGRGVVAR